MTFKDFEKFFVGFDFDNQFKRLDTISRELTKQTFPPYNIVRLNDNQFLIELAVSGFSESEIDIELTESSDGNYIKVSGKRNVEGSRNYDFRGIANRDFVRTFVTKNEFNITSTSLVNGLLTIEVQGQKEDRSPKKIPINKTLSEPGLLKG